MKEALKLALALALKGKNYAEECSHMATQADIDEFDTVSTAIKEALAQPEHHTLTSRVNDVSLHKERDRQRAEAMKMLAQPEQEPVALKLGECWPENVMQMWDYYRKEIANGNTGSEPRDWFESLSEMRLVDTTPPQRKPLTLVELSHIFASIPSIPFDGEWQLELARAIEAAHGIKE